MPADFTWRDAGRTVLFRRGGLARAVELLDEHGFASFELLSTERALSEAGGLRSVASGVHLVPPGPVPAAAAALMEEIGDGPLVALGGGRVIDTAKAIAAVRGSEVAAIPTTLSGAEMTGIHRLPAGAEDRAAGLVRPTLAIADPDLMTGLPEPSLRASAMNALAHGADSLYTTYANPLSRHAALTGAEAIASALDEGREGRDRGGLALGAVLCGYAIDSGLYALHHVTCQSLVRICGTPHAETNAAILPRAMAAMSPRAPEEIAALATAVGAEPGAIEERLLDLGGRPAGLGELGGDASRRDEAVEAILARAELGFAPEPPDATELRQLIDSAW